MGSAPLSPGLSGWRRGEDGRSVPSSRAPQLHWITPFLFTLICGLRDRAVAPGWCRPQKMQNWCQGCEWWEKLLHCKVLEDFLQPHQELYWEKRELMPSAKPLSACCDLLGEKDLNFCNYSVFTWAYPEGLPLQSGETWWPPAACFQVAELGTEHPGMLLLPRAQPNRGRSQWAESGSATRKSWARKKGGVSGRLRLKQIYDKRGGENHFY